MHFKAWTIHLANRLASAAAIIIAVTTLVFLLLHLIPGDPVEVMLGEYASGADREALRRALGLHQPLFAQWLSFMHGVLTFDLGTSLTGQEPVRVLIAQHFFMTLMLAVAGLVIAAALGVPLGILAALRFGTAWDTGARTFAVLGLSLPNFVLGPLLIIVFSVYLGWLPVSGSESPRALVLPALTLGLSMAAILARMTRAAVLDVVNLPYIRAARARGLRETAIVLRHVLPNAALPLVTTLGLQFGALLGGAVITEAIFAWEGLGLLIVESIQRRDYPVVQGGVLVISATYVLVNTATDLAYELLDPRIRSGQS